MAKPNRHRNFAQRAKKGFTKARKIIGGSGKLSRKFLNTANKISGGQLMKSPRFLAAHAAASAAARSAPKEKKNN